MNNLPLVSILIPFKNTAQFLQECIQSILDQKYTNWEVLAVNDHSSDGSQTIMANFALKDKRIQVFQNRGNGIIHALRTAYAKSSGAFITRMDSDDIMLPYKLQVMSNSLLEFGPGNVAVGQVKYFSHRGISNGYARYEQWLNRLTKTGANYTEIYKECPVPSPCWMTYREDLEASGAFKPDHYPEDYDLTFRFYEQGLKCISCNQILHLWRDYDTRTSRTSEHYAQNYFLDVKLHYFLKLDFDPSRSLIVWGAGKKGKTIAKGLLEREVNFYWICDNPKKIGKHIYGKEMMDFKALGDFGDPQSIITVANERAQEFIHNYLEEMGQKPILDYFFFC
ncbi:glycosyltransferase [Flavobacteriaceae bacterium F89]|uniref:Glycosyltransferase n=1 Tax=Cerina litoralis TaxID=2874477 RepID=A0AAE3EXN4_9FLAO|nr:glycosyltransferase [Cerina litoralis]MCG2462009.1 glycosyltransferase [Cerina litoralis]